MLIILLIIFPLLLFLGLFVFLVLLIRERQVSEIGDDGKMIFKLDLEKRKFLVYDGITNKVRNKEILKSTKKNEFIALSKLTSSFANTNGEKLIRNMFLKLSQGSEKESIFFNVVKQGKHKSFQYIFVASKTQDRNMYLLLISWKILNKYQNKDKVIKETSKEAIIKNTSPFKGFVAFNLNRYVEEIEEEFYKSLTSLFKQQKLSLFYSKGMFIVSFFTTSGKKLQKKLDYFVNAIQTTQYKNRINNLYCGSSIVKATNLNTPKRLNKILKMLLYNTYYSMKIKQDFVELQTDVFTKKHRVNYKNYIDSYQLFRQALKTHDITTKKIVVKSYSSNKKIMNYATPSVNGVANKNMVYILKSPYNWNSLINIHAETIVADKSISFPILIDINNKWLEANVNKILLKKVIYVITFMHYEDLSNVCNIITKFIEQGFVFAIRLKCFNASEVTLIKQFNPQFVVVDSKMSEKKDVNTYFHLLSLKKLTNVFGIKIIYENPMIYDHDQAKQIGLEYYYNS